MTTYDVRAKATAARMLGLVANGGKGQVVTLTREAAGVYNPATGAAAITPTTQTGSGVVFEYPITIRSRGGSRDEPNTLILAGDKQLLLSALNTTGGTITRPQAGDRATIAGVVYTITAVGPLSPAGTDVYYECNIRGTP